MAVRIRNDYAGSVPVYLTVMHGGMPFAAQLALELGARGLDLEFDYLHATRYRGAHLRRRRCTGSIAPRRRCSGRRVLLVDDIVDEGHTLAEVRDWCRSQGAADVRIAALAVKAHDRCVRRPVAPTTRAWSVPDRYVYGYGMDYHEQGRNLPAIYASEGSEHAPRRPRARGHRRHRRVPASPNSKTSKATCPKRVTDFRRGRCAWARIGGKRVAFLARHGEEHGVPPHKINYRANLAALQMVGATRVLALNTVGGITERFGPARARVPGPADRLHLGPHLDAVARNPAPTCCTSISAIPIRRRCARRSSMQRSARGVALVDGGCYGATQGPRLETKAEIARMRRDGCDLVGMTGMPEAGLARELGLRIRVPGASSRTGPPDAAMQQRSRWPKCSPTLKPLPVAFPPCCGRCWAVLDG